MISLMEYSASSVLENKENRNAKKQYSKNIWRNVSRETQAVDDIKERWLETIIN